MSFAAAHIPVLLAPLLAAVAPISGVWLDGTFGAGGYSRALLDAGATKVLAVDRDPDVFANADWAGQYDTRLQMIQGEFGELDRYAQQYNVPKLDGVVLDIGVSSMQLDQAQRGFSFMADGPLDMRMSQSGLSAADIVNTAQETDLADLFYLYGEERASRRIARNIVKARAVAPITTTTALCEIITNSLPRARANQAHPATRCFQALRIAVNDELGQLIKGLSAAENALGEGGILAIVTFHSLEDRIVKRFLQSRSGMGAKGNRYQPEIQQAAPQFTLINRKAIVADQDELAHNPRARSAKLRMARRTAHMSADIDADALGLPQFSLEKVI